MEVFDDLGGDYVRGWQISGVLQAVILEPEDVQVYFVPLEKVFVREAFEAFDLFACVAVLRMIAGDEIVQIFPFERICF